MPTFEYSNLKPFSHHGSPENDKNSVLTHILMSVGEDLDQFGT